MCLPLWSQSPCNQTSRYPFLSVVSMWSCTMYMHSSFYQGHALCWFQTSLPVAALPLRRVIIACCFRVTALSIHTALALSPSGIAPDPSWIEFNCLWSAAVGKAAGLSIYWQNAAYRLVSLCCKCHLRSCSKNNIEAAMRRAASGKLVWKQHYSAPLMSMREGGALRNEGLSFFFFFFFFLFFFFFFTPGLQYHMPKLQSMNYTSLFCFEGAVFLRS